MHGVSTALHDIGSALTIDINFILLNPTGVMDYLNICDGVPASTETIHSDISPSQHRSASPSAQINKHRSVFHTFSALKLSRAARNAASQIAK